MPVHRYLTVTLLAVALAVSEVQAQDAPAEQAAAMTWPEAAELLYRERLAAEVCTRVLKRHLPADDPGALQAAELDYEAARGDFNGVITGLQVALIENVEAPALETVEARMEAGTRALRDYCDTAEAMVPPQADGGKGVIGDIVSGTIGAVVEAAVTIWSKLHDDDKARRDSLRAVLEDAKWPSFASIEP